jgi:hypothetical protein
MINEMRESMERHIVNSITISTVSFSKFPGPRYCNQGEFSGEEYYHKVLNNAFVEALNRRAALQINLDGTTGYSAGFLDEAIGNLVYDFTKDIVTTHLKIISSEAPRWAEMVHTDILDQWEQRRIENNPPKKTKPHPAWSRMVNGMVINDIWIAETKTI